MRLLDLAYSLGLGVAGVTVGTMAVVWAHALVVAGGTLQADVNSRGEGWLEFALFVAGSSVSFGLAVDHARRAGLPDEPSFRIVQPLAPPRSSSPPHGPAARRHDLVRARR